MGGGGPSSTTSYQSNLPEYAEPYYKGLMNRAEDESEQPYVSYQDQRLYDQSADTLQSYGMVTDLANSGTPGLDQGAAYANQAGTAGLGMAGLPQYMINGTPGVSPYDLVGHQGFDQGIADQYMSPYMDAVVGRTKQNALSDYMEGQSARNAEAVQAGAFGGSRRFVQQSIGDRGLLDRFKDIQTQGLQSAYENAQQQFERDRTSSQGAQRTNIENVMRGDLANQQAFLTQEQANQQASQFGQNLGLQGAQLGLESGSTLADMQKMGDQIELDRTRALMTSGDQQQQYAQSQLDIGYNDFVNQRDSERQNLQFLSSILRGVPISANQDVQQFDANNPVAGAAGLAGIAALYGGQQ